MKRSWKLIIGTLFLIGGSGCVASDIGAAAFGIIVGVALISWWLLDRKKQYTISTDEQGEISERQREEWKYQEVLAKRQQEEQKYQEALAKRQPEEQKYQETSAKRQLEEQKYQEALAKRQLEEQKYQEALAKRQLEEQKYQETLAKQQQEEQEYPEISTESASEGQGYREVLDKEEAQRRAKILAKKHSIDQLYKAAIDKEQAAAKSTNAGPAEAFRSNPAGINPGIAAPALEFYRDKLDSRKALTSFDTYVVLDCETSGLSPKNDEIIEIAMMKYIKGEPAGTFSYLIAPSQPISPRITNLTGITNADLENAPPIGDIIPKVWEFIDGFVLVGHNIPFDIGFLKKQFAENGYEGHFSYVDTMQLARSAFPNFPNHKLATCIDELSLSDGQTHRALDDIICTQRLLERCLSVLLERKK